MNHFCYLCLMFDVFSCPFILALWSPAGKGLTSGFLVCFCYFPMWCPGSGVVLDCNDS